MYQATGGYFHHLIFIFVFNTDPKLEVSNMNAFGIYLSELINTFNN